MIDSKIKELKKHIGETVRIKGWLYKHRSSGKIAFLTLRDGSGIVQCILEKKVVGEEKFKENKKLTQETSLEVVGEVVQDDRAPGGVELHLSDFAVYHIAEPYPITPKEHGMDFLISNRHLWLRSSKQNAVLTVRDELIKAIRDFFYDNDFTLIDTPILTGSVGETSSTLFETKYFDLGKAYLAQTGQLYLEAAIFSFGKVYCFGPTFRAEKSKTRRHLTEFWMVEAESAFVDNNANMDLQETFVSYIVGRVLDKCSEQLKYLERNTKVLENSTVPFYRLSYTEAIDKLNEKGSDIKWGDDLGGDDETILTKLYDKPIFVYNYPKAAKAFYMKQNPEDDKTVLCADLLAPEGYGEIIGGSQREDDIDLLLKRIEEEGLDAESYEWYLDLRRYGSVVHSGFGLGIERTLSWITGIEHVREAIPFPRMIYRLYP